MQSALQVAREGPLPYTLDLGMFWAVVLFLQGRLLLTGGHRTRLIHGPVQCSTSH